MTEREEVEALVARTGHRRYLEWYDIGGRLRDGAVRIARGLPEPPRVRPATAAHPAPARPATDADPGILRVERCPRRRIPGCGCTGMDCTRLGSRVSLADCLRCVEEGLDG